MIRLLTFFCAISVLLAADCVATADGTRWADQAEAVRGNNAFAVDLYGQLKNQPGNLFFSPESISTALAMTYAGARGNTAKEMAKVLQFTLPPWQLHSAMAALLRDRNAVHDGYTLKEADALWGQEGYSFLPDFLNLTKENYGAGFRAVDFKSDSEGSRQQINQWIAQQTANKIQNLIGPSVLNAGTRLVLTNAIYFKGEWQTQFSKQDTKDEDFHTSSTQTVKAPMMHLTGAFSYFDGKTFQVLEIPYKNKELSMIVFLPMDVGGLAALEQSLTPAKMQEWLSHLRPASEVIVSMPKFKMEDQFSLADTLLDMGMKLAFDRKNADFSGMASKEEMLKDGNLNISAVIHKAYVDVNEEGTEATAASAVAMVSASCGGCGAPPPPIFIFCADHSFLFLIRDNKSGGILFMGRVTNPIE